LLLKFQNYNRSPCLAGITFGESGCSSCYTDAMDVEKTIQFILDMQAKHEVWLQKHEEAMKRHEEAMQRHEEAISRIDAALETGVARAAQVNIPRQSRGL